MNENTLESQQVDRIHATVQLAACSFERQEERLLEYGSLQASIFRYKSGVCGLRLANDYGNLVILPYQGQQIWSMTFAEQSLAMQSIFDEPNPTQNYLSTYGAFMLHCGLLGMGGPGPNDRHALHGELPNAPYQQAFVRVGSDDKGSYMEAGGSYRHSIAFTCDYEAEPLIRLYEDGTTVHICLKATNLKQVPMDYMYLAHVNFKPIDGGRFVFTAPCTAEHVDLYRELTAPSSSSAAYSKFIEKLKQNPALINKMEPEHILNPELLMYYRSYFADGDGWAHSLHIQPDGYAGYVKHRPDQLDKVLKWIVRTGSEEALGFALPATALDRGYTKEKELGNVRVIPAGGSLLIQLEIGLLYPEQATVMEQTINDLLAELE